MQQVALLVHTFTDKAMLALTICLCTFTIDSNDSETLLVLLCTTSIAKSTLFLDAPASLCVDRCISTPPIHVCVRARALLAALTSLNSSGQK